MPTDTTPDAVLNGITTCNQCNAGMALKQDEATGQLYFTCSQQAGQSFTGCLTPDLDANQLDKLVVEKVMETVMTTKHLNMLIAKTDQSTGNETGRSTRTARWPRKPSYTAEGTFRP